MILALTNKRGKKDEGVSSWKSKKMMYKIFFKHLTVKSFGLILGRHFSSLGMKMYLISLIQITKSYSKWQKSQTKMNNGQEGKIKKWANWDTWEDSMLVVARRGALNSRLHPWWLQEYGLGQGCQAGEKGALDRIRRKG